jgi:hypothetical protein
MRNGSVRRGINKGGNLTFLAELCPLVHLDLPCRIREIKKASSLFFVDGLSQIVALDNFDQPDSGGT